MQLFFYLAATFFLVSAFISNEAFQLYEPFIIFCLTFVFFIIFLLKDRYFKIKLTTPNVAFLIFILANIILLFDAYNTSQSLYQVLFYIQTLFIFIAIQQVASKHLLVLISKTFVILTTIFGLFSITRFVEIGLTATHKLNGIVGPAGVYGGFLIIPLLLSVYFLLNEKAVWPKRFWYFSTIVIFTSLFLTFAYDAWFILLLTLAILAYSFKKKFKGFDARPLLKPSLVILILSFTFFCIIWYMARETTLTRGQNISSEVVRYELESYEGDYFRSRFEQMTNAVTVFSYSPITGFGADSYSDISRVRGAYHNSRSLADPHNRFLKLLAENGIVVAVIFAIFIISLISKCAKSIFAQKDIGITLFVLTGLIASTLHALINADWSTNAIFMVWIVFAGLLYGYENNKKDAQDIDHKYFPNWSMYFLLVFSILSLIVSIQLLRADLAKTKGDIYFANKDYENALNSYFLSLTYYSYNDVTWYGLWKVYFAMNRFELAKDNIQKALDIYPENKIYKSALSKTLQMFDGGVDYPHNTP